jgi:toxin ParE1/3/4
VAFKVTFRPHAAADLDQIDDFIAKDNPYRAAAFVQRIRQHCESLRDMPERGPMREDLGRGVRILPFERRAVIAYRIVGKSVEILRIFYAGRDYEAQDLD